MIMNLSLIVILVWFLSWTKSQSIFKTYIFVSICRLCEQMVNHRMREGVDCVFWVMRKGGERELEFHSKLKTWKWNLRVNQYNRSTKLACTVWKCSMVWHKVNSESYHKHLTFIPNCTNKTWLFKECLIIFYHNFNAVYPYMLMKNKATCCYINDCFLFH